MICMAKTNTIITIGREYGSAGREIGYKVADYFGIKLYTSSFLYSLVMDTYSLGYSAGSYADMPINHKVFLAQFDTIKKIASEGPCILVGRCADYALEDFDNVYIVDSKSSWGSCCGRICRRVM